MGYLLRQGGPRSLEALVKEVPPGHARSPRQQPYLVPPPQCKLVPHPPKVEKAI